MNAAAALLFFLLAVAFALFGLGLVFDKGRELSGTLMILAAATWLVSGVRTLP